MAVVQILPQLAEAQPRLHAAFGRLQADFARLQDTLRQKSEALRETEDRLSELAGLHGQIAAKDEALREAEARLRARDAAFVDRAMGAVQLQQAVAELQERLASAQAALAVKAEALWKQEDCVAELSTTLKERDAELTRLRAGDVARPGRGSVQKELEEKDAQLRAKDATIAKLQLELGEAAQHRAKDATVARLQAQLAEMQTKMATANVTSNSVMSIKPALGGLVGVKPMDGKPSELPAAVRSRSSSPVVKSRTDAGKRASVSVPRYLRLRPRNSMIFGETLEPGGDPVPRELSPEHVRRRPNFGRAVTESATLGRTVEDDAAPRTSASTPRTAGFMRMRPRISTLRTSGAGESAKAAAEAAGAVGLSVGAGTSEVKTNSPEKGLQSLPLVPDRPTPELARSPELSPLTVPTGLRPELAKVCEVVLKRGWGSTKFPRNFTPLHLAARLGSKEAVSFLLSLGAAASLELRDDKGLTPRDYAESKGHVDLFPLLNQVFEPPPVTASPAAGPHSTEPPAAEPPAAEAPSAEPPAAEPPAAEPLTEEPPASEVLTEEPPIVEALDAKLRADVARASVPSNLPPKLKEACTFVFEKGWLGVRFPYGYTPLHMAAQFGYDEAVNWLLAIGARAGLRWQDEWGWTPLDYAESEGHEALLAVLTPASADEGASDSEQSEHWNIHEAPSLVEWPEEEWPEEGS